MLLTKHKFITQWTIEAYIEVVEQTDLTFVSAISFQVISPNARPIKDLYNLIRTVRETIELGTQFLPLDNPFLKVAVFSDAIFASNTDLTWQLGVLIPLMDKHSNATMLHNRSFKSKHVTTIVLTAKLFATV